MSPSPFGEGRGGALNKNIHAKELHADHFQEPV